jgi:hypothetical protein
MQNFFISKIMITLDSLHNISYYITVSGLKISFLDLFSLVKILTLRILLGTNLAKNWAVKIGQSWLMLETFYSQDSKFQPICMKFISGS